MGRAREKDSVEAYKALSISSLKAYICLQQNSCLTLSWWRQGKKTASIEVTIESRQHIRLQYLSRSYSLEPVKHDYPVRITWTPCHIGGERPWFRCPICDTRVAKLYGRTAFACRHCMQLNYRCQQVSQRDRVHERSRNLRQALGCDASFLFLPASLIPKPKGMHWRTFEQKIAHLKKVDDQALTSLASMLGSPGD